jgi:acetyl esterase/lipase
MKLSPCWILLLGATALFAQAPNEQNTPAHPPRTPDFADIHYGPNVRNDCDIYAAKSDKPAPLVLYFFPGGFVVGNKNTVPVALLDAAKTAGVTVASCNYRYVTDSPLPTSFQDAARALQFLRLHAADYNIDPRAVASTGSSAGADISLWLAFHDDMADPASGDPVLRQSTSICAAGALAAQTSLDPRMIAKLITPQDAQNRMWGRMYGLKPDEMESDRAQALYRSVSAVDLLTNNASPVFMYYSAPHKPITLEMPQGDRVHNPVFGFYLKERMDKAGAECVLRLKEDYKNPPMEMNREMLAFFLRHFPK